MVSRVELGIGLRMLGVGKVRLFRRRLRLGLALVPAA